MIDALKTQGLGWAECERELQETRWVGHDGFQDLLSLGLELSLLLESDLLVNLGSSRGLVAVRLGGLSTGRTEHEGKSQLGVGLEGGASELALVGRQDSRHRLGLGLLSGLLHLSGGGSGNLVLDRSLVSLVNSRKRGRVSLG